MRAPSAAGVPASMPWVLTSGGARSGARSATNLCTGSSTAIGQANLRLSAHPCQPLGIVSGDGIGRVVQPQEPPADPGEPTEEPGRRLTGASHRASPGRLPCSARARRGRARAPGRASGPSTAAAPHSSTSAAPAAPWHSDRSSISWGSAAASWRRVVSSASCGVVAQRLATEQLDGAQPRQRDAAPRRGTRCRPSPRRSRDRVPRRWPPTRRSGQVPEPCVEPRPLVGERALGTGAEPLVAGGGEQLEQRPADAGRAVREPAERPAVAAAGSAHDQPWRRHRRARASSFVARRDGGVLERGRRGLGEARAAR